MTFLKNDPRPCATLKEVFLDRFEVVVAHWWDNLFFRCEIFFLDALKFKKSAKI